MMRQRRRDFVKTVGAAALTLGPGCSKPESFSYASAWKGSRVWVGPETWANPLQDWRVEDGEVQAKAGAGRTLHLLTHQAVADKELLQMRVDVRRLKAGPGDTWAGFAFGIRGKLNGYQHALVHPAKGFTAGLREDGKIFVADDVSREAISPDDGVALTLTIQLIDFSAYEVRLTADPRGGGAPLSLAVPLSRSDAPVGNVALAAQAPGRPTAETSGAVWGFRDWQVGGDAAEVRPEQTFGPILWTQYTLSRDVLKLAALFPPIGAEDAQTCALEVRDGEDWKALAEAPIEPLSRTAVFRVADWDSARDQPYRVVYRWQDADYAWEGTVRRDPADAAQLKVAVFSCDHGECFPQQRMVRNVSLQDPDLVFFAGDQIYEGHGGFGVARDKPADEAMLDYLRKYWQHGWTWREILRDRPSIVIPDDHDVFQGNIWGQAGRALPPSPPDRSIGQRFADGGFLMPVDWVNAVQRTQAGHLPDPVDPAPCDSGIEVYFTELRYGGASFAILEDRKFKTGPNDILSERQRASGAANPKTVDAPGAELFGSRQEAFLRDWVKSSADAAFRVVCSQTILCKATTHAGGDLKRMVIDLDCGGWPQTPRDRALKILQGAPDVVMLHGDQHLGILARLGVSDWEDSALAFMVPGTSNGFPRAWWPEGAEWTGRFRDGLGNRMTILGVANPDKGSNTKEGQARLNAEQVAHIKGSGHGNVVLRRADRKARFEMWRHAFDAAAPGDADQFPGFPMELPLGPEAG
ncbi:MAG: hypothetical protein GC160_29465 [Acidobacteria bacterium]|nr:hypothetical protein [Acidobacteriota bacterium]